MIKWLNLILVSNYSHYTLIPWIIILYKYLVCNWSRWIEGECSKSCGTGYRNRTKIDNKFKATTGLCQNVTELEMCNQQSCLGMFLINFNLLYSLILYNYAKYHISTMYLKLCFSSSFLHKNNWRKLLNNMYQWDKNDHYYLLQWEFWIGIFLHNNPNFQSLHNFWRVMHR